MPLDGHGHLVSQGWQGKGTGLRSGSIAKPIIISQKKNLAGLGKDRDEAFPFWDHVFNAAVGSIQIKISGSDDEESGAESSDSPSSSKPQLKRTSTGILSNRRPLAGLSADSGSTTPTTSNDEGQLSAAQAPGMSRRNLMSLAKQEAARKGLYARFFRGPVLGPDPTPEVTRSSTSLAALEKGKGKEVLADTDAVVSGLDAATLSTTTTMMTSIISKRKRKETDEDEVPSPSPRLSSRDESLDQDPVAVKRKKKRKEDKQSPPTTNPSSAPDTTPITPSSGNDALQNTLDLDDIAALTKAVKRVDKERQKREARKKELKEVKKAIRAAEKEGKGGGDQSQLKELKKRARKLQRKLDESADGES